MKLSTRLVAVPPLLFLSCFNSVFSQEKPKMLISETENSIEYDWEKFYGTNPSRDSASSWVNSMDLLLPDITVTYLIEQYGKFFFRFNKIDVIEDLNKNLIIENYRKLGIDSQTEIIQCPFTKEYLDRLPPKPAYEQIWDERPDFIVNSALQNQNNHALGRTINTLSLLKDEKGNSFETNLALIKDELNLLKSQRIKARLLFDLAVKLYQIRAPIYDIKNSVIELSNTCYNAEFTPIEKATWLLACGKILATQHQRDERNSVYGYFCQAEGFLNWAPEENSSYINTLIIIKTFYLSENEHTFFKYNSYEEINPTSRFYDNKITIIDSFKLILLAANVEVSKGRLYQFYNMNVPIDVQLRTSLYLNCLNRYFQKKEIYPYCKDTEIEATLFRVYSSYFKNQMDYEKELKYVYKSISIHIQSKNNNDKLLLPDEYKNVASIYRNMGEYEKAKNLLMSIGSDRKEYDHFSFYMPEDLRLWKSEHFEKIKNIDFYYLNIDSSHDVHHWVYWMQFALNLSDYQASIGNFKEAYLLTVRADSIRQLLRYEQEVFEYYISNARLSFYVPQLYDLAFQIYNKDKIIIKKNNILLIGLIVLFTIVLSLYIAIMQWRRARKAKKKANSQAIRAEQSEARERIAAQTMYQMAHLGPQCINKVLLRFSKKMDKVDPNMYSIFHTLSNLLRGFYDYYRQDKITYEEEYNLVCKYVNLAHWRQDSTFKPSKLIWCNYKDFAVSNMPTYVLFNAVQNAFKHGCIGESDRIEIKLTQSESTFQMKVTNNIGCKEPINLEKGSGMDYMEKILGAWNEDEEYSLTPVIENDKFILSYTFNTIN